MNFFDEINIEVEKTFKTMFDLSPDGFLIADVNGKIQYMSDAGKKMFGFDDEDIKNGINLFEQVYIDDRERAKNNNIARAAGKYSGFAEYRVIKKDGSNFWNETNATFIKDSNENIKLIFVVFRDITVRKQQELDFQNYANNLHELNLIKDKFFSIIAHDLKNPFNGIMSFSDLLIEALEKSDIDKSLKFANIIKDASALGHALLINLLDWARLQTGKITINNQNISINEIIIAEIMLAKPLIIDKSIEIVSNHNNDIIIKTDKYVISTVIRNLINNAIKYSKFNSKIIIVSTLTNDVFSISIEDFGMGMNEQVQKKLFSLESVSSMPGTNNEKGTGLGLILCKDLISMLGGSITVTSEINLGSKFLISLPIKNNN